MKEEVEEGKEFKEENLDESSMANGKKTKPKKRKKVEIKISRSFKKKRGK